MPAPGDRDVGDHAALCDKRAMKLHWKLVALFAAATLYWVRVASAAGVAEPWDATAYWRLWYPLALLVSALAGWFFPRHGWLAGVTVIVAQLPVLLLAAGNGAALWAAGVVFLTLLAIPAALVSALAGRLAARRR